MLYFVYQSCRIREDPIQKYDIFLPDGHQFDTTLLLMKKGTDCAEAEEQDDFFPFLRINDVHILPKIGFIIFSRYDRGKTCIDILIYRIHSCN